MSQIRFFALKDDLIPVLDVVERKGPLKYTLTGNFLVAEMKGEITVFETGTDIPDLGTASGDQQAACDSFLVCEGNVEIRLRRIRGNDGDRVCVDQLVNADTVTFTPGGIWNGDVVLSGRVATVSDTVVAQTLMRRFKSAIKKTFTKVGAYYIGPNALTLLKSGRRLTDAVQSPPEYDLKL
jgi:hypothetical protein